MERYWVANGILASNECGGLVKYDDAQRALDAEREKVKELECYRALWKRRDDELTGVLAQRAALQARATELERDNAAMKQLFDANPSALWAQLATLQAQLADRDAMILQMGEQAAVLAKESMAVKAQLRQVEGQSQQQAEEAVIVFAKYTTLRQLLEDVLHTFGYLRFHRVAGMDGLLYETHNKMSPERTVEACEKRIRATLAAKDAPLTDE